MTPQPIPPTAPMKIPLSSIALKRAFQKDRVCPSFFRAYSRTRLYRRAAADEKTTIEIELAIKKARSAVCLEVMTRVRVTQELDFHKIAMIDLGCSLAGELNGPLIAMP